MNDLDICLEVVSRSCQPLRYFRRWISRKPLETESWLQWTTNRKWHMGYQLVTWPMTSHDPQRCCEAVRSAILATAWLLVLLTPRHASYRSKHVGAYSSVLQCRPSVPLIDCDNADTLSRKVISRINKVTVVTLPLAYLWILTSSKNSYSRHWV